jgi:Leucine-rich repeat (LRR) protein
MNMLISARNIVTLLALIAAAPLFSLHEELVRVNFLVLNQMKDSDGQEHDVWQKRYTERLENKLEQEIPADLIIHTRSIDLSAIKINRLPAFLFNNFRNLQDLHFADNDLSNVSSFELFNKLSDTLRVLGMGYCKLNSIPPQLGNLKKLVKLYLSGNCFVDEDFSFLRELKMLKIVSLRDCDLSTVPEEIEDLQQLEGLDLSCNPRLKDANLSVVNQLPRLRTLALQHHEEATAIFEEKPAGLRRDIRVKLGAFDYNDL